MKSESQGQQKSQGRKLWVQKYGGTSVGSPERIRAVARRIAEAHRRGISLVVVVSAMGDTTDNLIELAKQVAGAPPQREMDMLLTAGERISMALTCMALTDLKIPALSFTGSQSGIITDESHQRARIKKITPYRIEQALDLGQVAIVAGFQGVSESREITTLGRGGSDTTAVALAVALGAERCEIYTDVDGVFSADPRKVSDAIFWSELPASLMIEMATRGAGVLHPRCVELAAEHHLDLWVKNSFKEGNTIKLDGNLVELGTRIIAESKGLEGYRMEKFSITGIVADESKFFLEVRLARPGAVLAFWEGVSASQLTALSPSLSEQTVRLYGEVDSLGEWKRLLGQLISDGFVLGFKVRDDLVPLSVVGLRFSQDSRALKEILETLSASNVVPMDLAASPLSICLAIPRNSAQNSVTLLHRQFFG